MVRVNASGLFALLAQLVLAWVFIRAGLPKVEEPAAFAVAIDGFRIVSGRVTLWLALSLPWLEIVIGIASLTPWLRRASHWTMAFLLLVFMGLHTSAWARGLDISCGCFGETADSPDYHWLILRNLGLFLLAIFILRLDSGDKKTCTKALPSES